MRKSSNHIDYYSVSSIYNRQSKSNYHIVSMSFFNDWINVRHRAAISINNSAVTLLQREQYRDSVESFRVSISIMQAVLDRIKGSDIENSLPIFDREINHHLQDATHRCAKANALISRQSKNKHSVLAFYSQQDPNVAFDAIIEEARDGATDVFTCVIIEPIDQDNVCLELDCYTILYNFGVAHCLLAYKFFSSNLKSDQILVYELRQNAFQLFRQLEPYFLTRILWCPSKLDDRRVLLLCALFAKSMFEVASHLHYTTVCESYKSTLLACLVSIYHEEKFIPTQSRPASAA
jgi:hypothetical protein